MNESLFLVDRPTYKQFVRQIKPGCGRVEEVEERDYKISKIFSKKTDKCWCARKSFYDSRLEEYYIFDFPDADEGIRYIPRPQVELTDIKQIKKVLEYLFRQDKDND